MRKIRKFISRYVKYLLIPIIFTSCSKNTSTPTVFEIRAASITPIDGYLKKENEGSEIIYIDDKNIISSKHINYASSNNNKENPLLVITLTNKGEKIMNEVTSKMVGGRLAIIINGNIESTPVLREAISGKTIAVSINSLDKVRKIASSINN